jgi:hypothetical protein
VLYFIMQSVLILNHSAIFQAVVLAIVTPVSSLAFGLPAFGGTPITWNLILSLVIVVAGVVVYRLPRPKYFDSWKCCLSGAREYTGHGGGGGDYPAAVDAPGAAAAPPPSAVDDLHRPLVASASAPDPEAADARGASAPADSSPLSAAAAATPAEWSQTAGRPGASSRARAGTASVIAQAMAGDGHAALLAHGPNAAADGAWGGAPHA